MAKPRFTTTPRSQAFTMAPKAPGTMPTPQPQTMPSQAKTTTSRPSNPMMLNKSRKSGDKITSKQSPNDDADGDEL